MAILNNNPLVGASGNQGGYNINNSLRFRSSASANLTRTPSSAGNRKTFTFSAWIKRGTLSVQQVIMTQGSGNRDIIRIGSDNQLYFYWYDGTTYQTTNTTQVFRDPSAWFHLVVACDTTQATAANRIKIYINGSQITALANANYPSQNYDFTYWNTTNPAAIFKDIVDNNNHFDGYMTEVNFVDGQALTPSSFGETDTTTGVWKPKAYTGTYGTNGFYLKFSDIATTSGSNAGLGKDFSGNTNYWTTNNISVTSGTTYDAMTDSPTNTSATVANYCTINPISFSKTATISNGNLSWSIGAVNTVRKGTIGASSGKWYFEATNFGTNSWSGIGWIPADNFSDDALGTGTNSFAFYIDNTGNLNKRLNGTVTSLSTSVASSDILSVAIDIDAGKAWVGKNNTWLGSGDPVAGTNPTITFTANTLMNPQIGRLSDNATTATGDANFGQRPFSYTPPTGFVALNTFNLPTPTILQGNKYMDATLYTGNGSTQTITNASGFKPDWVWLKERSSTSSNNVYDSIRGTTKYLLTNATDAEGTDATSLTAFNSNGFSLGGAGFTNENAQTYVGWQWQAGQGTNTTNTSGSITSTVSVNTTAGFSVVTWANTSTNATIGHGLGVAPKMIIAKNRTGTADSWLVYHSALGATKFLRLESTAAEATNIVVWNNTAPTSTVFSIGTGLVTGNFVAYCWAEITGFSKFSSYTGNGSTDGTFVYTGFRPEFIMFKRTNDVSDWNILDATRSPYNTSITRLFGNSSNAENSSAGNYDIDILSNGFKQRNTNTSTTSNSNLNGSTYIYMAFAENPFKNALAR